jgi:hypothetical protein
MTRRLRRLLPQPLRFRLWMLRESLTREALLRRHAQPSCPQRLAAKAVIARRARRLPSADGTVGIERLSAVRVINLASRPDRLERVRRELSRLHIDRAERFEAIPEENGFLGCARSHADCLAQAIRGPGECAMVCEDDVTFCVDRRTLDVLIDAFLDDPLADVACLAYFASRTARHSILFRRGTYIRTAACYVVKARVVPELLDVWQRGIQELARGGDPGRYACDKTWMPLQQRRVFLVPINRAARQASGYSDVQRRVVAYTH